MITFNGKQFAAEKEQQLQKKLQQLSQTHPQKPHVGCLVFVEDQGGLVYAQEKKQVATRLGIEYDIVEMSIGAPLEQVQQVVTQFANNPRVTGIIIQKPWRKNWATFHDSSTESFHSFQKWWHELTSLIPLPKDIDGLHPETLQFIKVGNWREKKAVLPATCRAVLSILEYAKQQLGISLAETGTLIIGRSELMGTPLYHELTHRDWHQVQLIGQAEFSQLVSSPAKLTEYKTLITATGIAQLVTDSMVQPGCIVIDAGFPQGDVDFPSVSKVAEFITPVPHGVGPVTVISLLENVVELCYN